jgi:monoamine oxidase
VWYIAQSGGCKRIFETEGGAQDSKVQGGAGQIALQLAHTYANGPDKLSLQTPIRSISDCATGGVVLCGDNGLEVRAKYVILAIPPVQMLRIQYTPSLPASRFQSLQRWPMGCICKTFVYYDHDFWTPLGLNGSIVADDGIVCVTYDDTQQDGSKPCIMGFVLSAEALKCRSPEERRHKICEQYARCFGTDKALKSVGYKEKMWAEEQWVGGCYVGTVGPGVLTTCKRAHCEPMWGSGEEDGGKPKVHIAGTEAAWRMIGYMDGAVESGERAARNVLVQLGHLPQSEYNVMSQPAPSPQMPHTSSEASALEKMLPSVGTVLAMGACLAGIAAVALGSWMSDSESK